MKEELTQLRAALQEQCQVGVMRWSEAKSVSGYDEVARVKDADKLALQ